MTTANKIIVGIDFSQGAVSALHQALRIATTHGATLELFHVVPRLVLTDLAEALGRSESHLEDELVNDAQQQLEGLLPDNVDRSQIAVKCVVGHPLDELLKETHHETPRLLVLGVTGESGGSHGAGTYAKKCIRKAPCDVLLVHEQQSGPFRTVVACTDFSPPSKRALADAVQIARRDDSTLLVLHVYYGPWHKLHYRSPTPEAAPEFRQQYMIRLQRLLEAFVNPFSAELDKLDCQPHLHEHQSYGRGIVEYAQAHDADLIVLGTLGTSNLRYMLLGSTAERVLRETTCSVLAIRAGQTSE